MAEYNELKTRIVLKNDTAANLKAKNPVLLKGEMCIEIDTNKFKFGDGVTAYNELPYAVDITLDADHVFMTADIVATKAIGVWTPDSTGSVKIPYQANGEAMSVQAWLQSLAGKAENPTITQPSASITLTGAGAKEAGTRVTPAYAASLNPGKYQYGPATGIVAKSYRISDGATEKNTASGSYDEIQVTDGMNYKLTAEITYDASTVAPLNNLKVEVPSLKIAAGSKSATSASITSYRNVFYGSVTSKAADPDNAAVRALGNKSNANWGKGKTFNCPEAVGAMRVIIAVPATLTCTSIKDVNGLNAEALSAFKKITVNVEGANGYTAIPYNVYYKDNATACDKANNWAVTLG